MEILKAVLMGLALGVGMILGEWLIRQSWRKARNHQKGDYAEKIDKKVMLEYMVKLFKDGEEMAVPEMTEEEKGIFRELLEFHHREMTKGENHEKVPV